MKLRRIENTEKEPALATEKVSKQEIERLIDSGEWENLTKLGKQAVKQLGLTLQESKDIDTKLKILQTLGKIGDPEAINYILKIYPTKELIQSQAEALAFVGKTKVKMLHVTSISLAWAVCEIGDKTMIESLVNWIFDMGTKTGYVDKMSPAQRIRQIPIQVLSKLLGSYTEDILDLFDYRIASASLLDWKTSTWDMSKINAAIQRLCLNNTPVSTYILQRVTDVFDLFINDTIDMSTYRGPTNYTRVKKTLSYGEQRTKAKEELARRGYSTFRRIQFKEVLPFF